MTVFYKNFLTLCASHKKSPYGVAHEVGLSNATASGWKQGKQPSQVTLEKLSKYFNVSVMELTSGQDESSSFYNTFVSLCNSAGKSPSRVVLDVGLQKSSITRWKSGGSPTDATAKKLADYFGVTVEELIGGQKESPQPEAEAIGPNKRALLDAIADMSEAEMALLLERANKIKESR